MAPLFSQDCHDACPVPGPRGILTSSMETIKAWKRYSARREYSQVRGVLRTLINKVKADGFLITSAAGVLRF